MSLGLQNISQAGDLQIYAGQASGEGVQITLSVVKATTTAGQITPGVYLLDTDIDCHWAVDATAVATDLPLKAGSPIVVVIDGSEISAISTGAGTLVANRLGDIA